MSHETDDLDPNGLTNAIYTALIAIRAAARDGDLVAVEAIADSLHNIGHVLEGGRSCDFEASRYGQNKVSDGQTRGHRGVSSGTDGKPVPHEHGFEYSDRGFTGRKVRELDDNGKPGERGHKGRDHYHRPNPNKTSKGDARLDADGNPVPKGSDSSHLYPPGGG